MLRKTQEERDGIFPQTILEGFLVSLGVVPAPVYREGCDTATVYRGILVFYFKGSWLNWWLHLEQYLDRTSAGQEVLVAAYSFIALHCCAAGEKPKMFTRRNKELLDGFISCCKVAVSILRIRIVKPANKSLLKRFGDAQVISILMSSLNDIVLTERHSMV